MFSPSLERKLNYFDGEIYEFLALCNKFNKYLRVAYKSQGISVQYERNYLIQLRKVICSACYRGRKGKVSFVF